MIDDALDWIPADTTVAVVGLGYVGLALAAVLADAGFHVLGFDKRPERTAPLRDGASPYHSPEPELGDLLQRNQPRLSAPSELGAIGGAAVVFVCVDTPIEADRRPRYEALRGALSELGPHLGPGALVVVESTVAPGTMRGVVIPALEAATGGVAGARFFVGHCPERVTSGRLIHNLRAMARVCGGDSPRTSARMIALYRHLVRGELDASDLETAELVKTAENAYRDVNIAFANELARICEGAGADFLQVRALVNKSPGRDVLLAGPGVGGHCIPKDSWLLAAGAPDVTPWLLTAARQRNDDMPAHVLARTATALGGSVSNRRLAVLGYAYRENVDDVRETPSQRFVELARAAGAEVVVHDPFVPELAVLSPVDVARDADALVVLVAHAPYAALPLDAIATVMRTRVIFDARRVFAADRVAQAGFEYHGLGVVRRRPVA